MRLLSGSWPRLGRRIARLLLTQRPCSTPFMPRTVRFVSNNENEDVRKLFGEAPDVGDDEDLVDTSEHQEMLKQYHLVPADLENLLVIQPFKSTQDEPDTDTEMTPQLKLEETLALVKTLGWFVEEHMMIEVTHLNRPDFFGWGTLMKLMEKIKATPVISAVFISTYRLTAPQRINLEELLGVPIFDRYSIVLQIFHRHARTAEAKLQVSLAEIPYLKARLFGDRMFENQNKHSKQRLGESFFEAKETALKRREQKLKAKLQEIRFHRAVRRKNRLENKVPTVAVVGYTNCGKTSLIKALTNGNLVPQDRLFATLDVTVHSMVLPSSLRTLFVDTVGFISDIPTSLIASFASTLEDVALADVIIHVRDISHPNTVAQKAKVITTLRQLNVRPRLLETMISVGNKIDMLDESEWTQLQDADYIPISATEGFGLDLVVRRVERTIMEETGRKKMVFRCKTGSEEYNWLVQNVTISSSEADDKDMNYSLLSTVVLPYDLERFKKAMRIKR